MKTSLSINHDLDSDWLTQTSKKNRKSTLKASSPVSSSLQQIISNPPSLITNDTAFNYNNNNLLSPSANASTAMLIDINANTSNIVDSIPVSSIHRLIIILRRWPQQIWTTNTIITTIKILRCVFFHMIIPAQF